MLLIVNDAVDASSQNATIPEKLSRARTWSRLLFGLIPENELQLAFDLAFARHSGPFPVNAYEIKDAWEVYDAERRAKTAESPTAEEIERREQELIEQGVLKVSPIISQAEGIQIVRDYLAKLEAEKEAKGGVNA